MNQKLKAKIFTMNSLKSANQLFNCHWINQRTERLQRCKPNRGRTGND